MYLTASSALMSTEDVQMSVPFHQCLFYLSESLAIKSYGPQDIVNIDKGATEQNIMSIDSK